MAHKSTFEVKFRRRREGKTNYQKRLAQVKSKKLRLVVRKTNTRILVQAIKYNPRGDEIIAAVDSRELKKYGWYGTNNTPSAYLCGYLIGKKLGKKECVLDIGLKHPSHGSVIFAALKGAVDAGIAINHSKEALPAEERINGKALDDYANKLGEKAKTIFSKYIKEGITPGNINSAFMKAKKEVEKVKA